MALKQLLCHFHLRLYTPGVLEFQTHYEINGNISRSKGRPPEGISRNECDCHGTRLNRSGMVRILFQLRHDVEMREKFPAIYRRHHRRLCCCCLMHTMSSSKILMFQSASRVPHSSGVPHKLFITNGAKRYEIKIKQHRGVLGCDELPSRVRRWCIQEGKRTGATCCVREGTYSKLRTCWSYVENNNKTTYNVFSRNNVGVHNM